MYRRDFVRSFVSGTLTTSALIVPALSSVNTSCQNTDESLKFIKSNSEFAWYRGKITVSPRVDYKELIKSYNKYTSLSGKPIYLSDYVTSHDHKLGEVEFAYLSYTATEERLMAVAKVQLWVSRFIDAEPTMLGVIMGRATNEIVSIGLIPKIYAGGQVLSQDS